MARKLGEAERDDQLPGRDDRPAPDEHASDRRQSEEEEGEDAGRRRDIRERDGERAEDTQRPPQLLLVSESLEVSFVAPRLSRRRVVNFRHRSSSRSRLPRRFTHGYG